MKIRERQMLAQAAGEQVRSFPPTFEIGDLIEPQSMGWNGWNGYHWSHYRTLALYGMVSCTIMYTHL